MGGGGGGGGERGSGIYYTRWNVIKSAMLLTYSDRRVRLIDNDLCNTEMCSWLDSGPSSTSGRYWSGSVCAMLRYVISRAVVHVLIFRYGTV